MLSPTISPTVVDKIMTIAAEFTSITYTDLVYWHHSRSDSDDNLFGGPASRLPQYALRIA